MAHVLSVNRSRPMAVPYTDAKGGMTGIGKQPVEGPVGVAAPGPRGQAGSGVAGDAVCDWRFHGGDEQAVYAYAREDLDGWERELGRTLAPGAFGENLTTQGIDVNSALIGERWRIGAEVVLEVTSGRIPCKTFAGWLDEKGWVKRFTRQALPGPFFRVVTGGQITAGDPITVLARPGHEVTVAFLFRAMTTEPELLERALAAEDVLNATYAETIRTRLGR
jgi:MOSC domain-containing protein YiiM